MIFLSEAVALVRGIKDGLCPYLRRQLDEKIYRVLIQI
jgi:hypothetical protein